MHSNSVIPLDYLLFRQNKEAVACLNVSAMATEIRLRYKGDASTEPDAYSNKAETYVHNNCPAPACLRVTSQRHNKPHTMEDHIMYK